MTPADAPVPDIPCLVFAASDICATVGANIGDPISAAASLSPGDVYELRQGAAPLRAMLSGAPGAQRLGPVSDIGSPGAPVAIEARLTLMAPDGHRVEVLVLRIADMRFALPLAPMAARVGYTLLQVDASPVDLRLADMLCASFGPGTRITLADGSQRAIEALVPGDRVLTRDHGAQPVRWIGHVTLRALGGFAPVVIPAGVMGNAGDLTLSPHHRLFLYNRRLARLTGMPELLVPAGLLVDDETVIRREGGFADYRALVFDRHEIIYAEGIPAESLLVTEATVARLPDDLAEGVRAAFPDLAQDQHFGLDAGADLLAAVGRAALVRGAPHGQGRAAALPTAEGMAVTGGMAVRS